jgi:hypothetical protein
LDILIEEEQAGLQAVLEVRHIRKGLSLEGLCGNGLMMAFDA